jgi:hypothetical protein
MLYVSNGQVRIVSLPVLPIRIHIDLALLDPVSFWDADPDPEDRKLIKINKQT